MADKQRIMVALGGNALGATVEDQKQRVQTAAQQIVDLISAGFEVAVVHGNGPQVGMIELGLSAAYEAEKIGTLVPLTECGAMSQGYIGYHLQNALGNELAKRRLNRQALTVVTQVVVAEDDPAFQNPTKPIGAFYTKEQAAALARQTGMVYREDASRGYRKVVASPKPVDIVEKDAIEQLVASGAVVVAAGGGGIPVIRRDGSLQGINAVIDKDLAAEKLAELLDCGMLLILTAVEQVAVNYGKPDQQGLSSLTLEQVDKYIAEGQFAPGSMLPKIEAARQFAQSRPGRVCVISSLEHALEAVKGSVGTKITF